MSNPQMEKEEIEWSTKDPLTGEIIYLEKGILYSKFPLKEKTKIINLNEKKRRKAKKRE